MGTGEATRKELLERWSDIVRDNSDDAFPSPNALERHGQHRLKELWFFEAFNFLICLPKENHIWCGHWELMGPLLETFYNYFEENTLDSPLKCLWNRISGEMKGCTPCIHRHHQAKEMYATEYEETCVRPLIDVFSILDGQRICQHLKDLNARIAKGVFDMTLGYQEVVCVMFEVLMFPLLLDDCSLAMEFEIFIESIDDSYELALDENQHYPGVYALLFSKRRRVRSIGLRLAGRMGKLRKSAELDPLQHLIKKCICILETEVIDSFRETSRVWTQMDRTTVWIGIKALVGLLEPRAFEEGILDRYPVFLSIVLNSITDDLPEFSHAANCLRLLFQKIGCKLWLRAAISPGVMRNSLLGQCFRSRNEKSHKEIFDLFEPFLQSLEALQDGEHEKQRRHFLYFLLHQAPVSGNFTALMKKKACQIGLLIVLRGYRMDPPCPPSECAHVWGPSLVCSLKDTSLHSSLRHPAFDLIQTIIISDASAFISVILRNNFHPSNKVGTPNRLGNMEDEDEFFSGLCVKEKNASCWEEFRLQQKIMSQVDGSWMCVPMLWFDVLVEIDPPLLPLSFSKAVFWALSQFPFLEPVNDKEMCSSVRNWLATCASEVSYLLGWKVPTTSDDGGDGMESKNSIRISTMCQSLARTFKRLVAHFIIRMEQGELKKRWTWEPMMGSSLILLLVDPNDDTRQVGRLLLEQVSDVRGLTGGLQFMCSTPAAMLAILFGLRHALELVQLDSVILKFWALHHLFFVIFKLLNGEFSAQVLSRDPSVGSCITKYSNQGGFLKKPSLNCLPSSGDVSSGSSAHWKKLGCLLAEIAWRPLLKCLEGGKPFTGDPVSQMTCIRLLELMPVVFEGLPQNSGALAGSFLRTKWLHDLADWGKSSLGVVARYWKQTLASMVSRIRELYPMSASLICDIDKLISCENIAIDELSDHVALLAVILRDEGCASTKYGISKSPLSELPSDGSSSGSMKSEIGRVVKPEADALEKKPLPHFMVDNIIVLDDDEKELEVLATTQPFGDSPLSQSTGDGNIAATCAVIRQSKADSGRTEISNYGALTFPDFAREQHYSFANSKKEKSCSDDHQCTTTTAPTDKVKAAENKRVETGGRLEVDVDSFCKKSMNAVARDEITTSVTVDSVSSHFVQSTINKDLKRPVEAVKDAVDDTDSDPWEFSFAKGSNQPQLLGRRPGPCPKRQVIQLNIPTECKPRFTRLVGGVRRFQSAKLDDWYKPILQLDFFLTVTLAPPNDKDQEILNKLKVVPVSFRSSDEYIEIFRALALQEFKAQLHNSYRETSYAEEMGYGVLSVLSIERIDDFHVVRFLQNENESVGSKSICENDLISLTRHPLEDHISSLHTVGKLERRERDCKTKRNILVIRMYLRGCSRPNKATKKLTVRSKWYASSIMNITPQLREFQALSSIREIPLAPIILNPGNHLCNNYDSGLDNICKLPDTLRDVLKTSYNGSQLQAISAAIGPLDSNKEFDLTLIQGPPGTGKTRTIVAIVHALLAFFKMKYSRRARRGSSVPCSNPQLKSGVSSSAVIAKAWQEAGLAREINQGAKNNIKSIGSCSRGRILICAQSNAAVDELVARVCAEGLYDDDGQRQKPYLVRVGNAKSVHPNSLPFYIDSLVEDRVLKEKSEKPDDHCDVAFADSLNSLRTNLEKLADQIRYYEATRATMDERNFESKHLKAVSSETNVLSDAEIKLKLRELYESKKAISLELAHVQSKSKKAAEEIRALRNKFRSAILREAEIVVSTLSGSGGDLYSACCDLSSGQKFCDAFEYTLFDAVVIDEAAQALEIATLIPLQLLKSRGSRCIMVGDPKQLPATVLSNVASKCFYQCSMFERLQRAGYPVIMLTQQYRMHPEISHFPSLHFYDGKLVNGNEMSNKAMPFHDTCCLGPYVLFDITDGQELRQKNAGSLSLCNEYEVDAALEMLRFFKTRYPSEFSSSTIGIITPYKRQLSLFRSWFSVAFGPSVVAKLEFNTVDGFQGREVDILLLSTVRAAGSCYETSGSSFNNLGFVADVRRMNVALTRAKSSLWIFGNLRALQTNHSWAVLIEDAKSRNLVIKARKPYTSIFSSASESKSSMLNIQVEEAVRVKTIGECIDTREKSLKNASKLRKKCTGAAHKSVCPSEDVSPSASAAARVEKGDRTVTSLRMTRDSTYWPSYGKNDEEKSGHRKHSAGGRITSIRSREPQRLGADETCVEDCQQDEHPQVNKDQPNEVEVGNDLFMQRKHQRKAVDALLSSSLVSFRKSIYAGESANRTAPLEDTGDQPTRAPKRKNC